MHLPSWPRETQWRAAPASLRRRFEVGKRFFLDGDDGDVVAEARGRPWRARNGNRPLPAMRPMRGHWRSKHVDVDLATGSVTSMRIRPPAEPCSRMLPTSPMRALAAVPAPGHGAGHAPRRRVGGTSVRPATDAARRSRSTVPSDEGDHRRCCRRRCDFKRRGQTATARSDADVENVYAIDRAALRDGPSEGLGHRHRRRASASSGAVIITRPRPRRRQDASDRRT